MKITFVTTHLTIYGGAGVFLMDYANKLAENGYEIAIIAQKILTPKYHFDPRIQLIELGGPLPSNPIHWLKMFHDIQKRYVNALSQSYSDILLPQFFPVNYFCHQVDHKFYKKIIYYCHEPFRYTHDKEFFVRAPLTTKIISIFLRLFYNKAEIKGARFADAIVCNSDFIRLKVKEAYRS